MFPFRVIDEASVRKLLDMKNVIELVERAYTLKEQKEASLFPMVFHEFAPGKADMDIKSGHLKGAHIFGLKLVSWFGDNPSKELPALVGFVMVLDSDTGVPKGMMSGEPVTLMRTGAAGGIGAKYFARPESENLLLVGSGHLAPYEIMATLSTMEHIKKVTVYNANSYERAAAFCTTAKDKLKNMFLPSYQNDQELYQTLLDRIDIEYVATDNIRAATEEADIIITATPSHKPIIMKEWVKPGTHFSCVGADMAGKQEIDENLFSSARVFVDDVTQAINVGETKVAVQKGLITKDDIISEIGSVILGKTPGRLSDQDITIYDSTGIALQDLITADYVLKKAEEQGIGTIAQL
ncbi:ornithine cyclodeaminase family protein [Brevibacillus centrosporus]|uniref:ornithine cyclodeaminase family protein n=1 Tax=Brevibacillus centrosporus TaxID=54910 RepID=UPI000F09D51B|nr:ornithine cyclodeaminase family protein [Brevibacillus centrosporus]MEC2128251.1 ornithine cyclodeaminase family protein [Brevibacillus centrosporus]RNB73892.1 ornithine cyclodeaminase family protein [Brevibacillus centrosporus]GED30710.1 alanine dehydrogenase [Brevibacillus centrosporus]